MNYRTTANYRRKRRNCGTAHRSPLYIRGACGVWEALEEGIGHLTVRSKILLASLGDIGATGGGVRNLLTVAGEWEVGVIARVNHA
jgi:hypothetical protein